MLSIEKKICEHFWFPSECQNNSDIINYSTLMKNKHEKQKLIKLFLKQAFFPLVSPEKLPNLNWK